MHDYSMLADGDKLLLAVSGGIDSLVMARVMSLWFKKAPINYQMEAVLVDHKYWQEKGPEYDPALTIGGQLEEMGVASTIVSAWGFGEKEFTCFQCARNRRSQLFDLAREKGCNKVVFGHHKDDLIETFFLNILYSGNISTMLPKQVLFDGRLDLIRPLAYLEKEEVVEIGKRAGLIPVPNYCPLGEDTRREKVRSYLNTIYKDDPASKRSIFASLSNVREGYLL